MHRGRDVGAIRILIALCVTLGATFACATNEASSDGGSGQLKKVTMVFSFPPSFANYYYFAALDKGFYRDVGLDVNFIVPDSTSTAAKFVSLNLAQFGEVIGADPIAAVNSGLSVKVVATTNYLDLGLMALPDRVTSLGDIKGGTVAAFTSLEYTNVCRARMLAKNGLSEGDIKTVDAGFSSVPPLLTKQVIASEGALQGEMLVANTELNGAQVNFFSYSDVCPPSPVEWIANTQTLQNDPDMVRKFISATLNGIKYSMENPDDARAIFVKHYPESNDPVEYWNKFAKTFCRPAEGNHGLGFNDENVWNQLISVAREGKSIDKEIHAHDVITNKFLPGAPTNSTVCA